MNGLCVILTNVCELCFFFLGIWIEQVPASLEKESICKPWAHMPFHGRWFVSNCVWMIHSFKQESWVSESIMGQCQSLSLQSWSMRGTLLCLLTALGSCSPGIWFFSSGACDCFGGCFEKCVLATFLLWKLPRDQIAFPSSMKPSVLWFPVFCLCRPTTMASSHDFSRVFVICHCA